MTSLRSRLILGSSLIAVVPLALAMFLLSRRVETMVRTQADERLSAALAGLQAQLEADAVQVEGKLRILARDPTLRRLYLVGPTGDDLSAYLEERRFLLGLDFLQVADTRGAVAGAAGAADSGLAIAASAPILYQSATAGLLRGGAVLDARFLERSKRTLAVDLVLRDRDGRAVAATLAGAEALAPSPGEPPRVRLAGGSYSSRSVPLALGAGSAAVVTGLVSTASADRTIAALQLTSLLLGVLGVAIAIGLGMVWSSQVSGPVERLAAFSQRLSHGEWDEPLKLESVRELQALVTALDRMRGDLRRYRDRLVTSERHAAWGLMARTIAHEIKNPLTPIAVSVADLKRSFDQQRPDFPQILDQAVKVVGEEVQALKRLLDEFAEFGRLPAPEFAACDLAALLADLETLYGHEVAGGRLGFAHPGHPIPITADAAQLSRALVNLIQNGLEASRGGGRVTVSCCREDGGVRIAVTDTGHGLSAEQRANLFVPGFTTKAAGSGLGLTIVERIVNDHQGAVQVVPVPGNGTTFEIRLPLEPRS